MGVHGDRRDGGDFARLDVFPCPSRVHRRPREQIGVQSHFDLALDAALRQRTRGPFGQIVDPGVPVHGVRVPLTRREQRVPTGNERDLVGILPCHDRGGEPRVRVQVLGHGQRGQRLLIGRGDPRLSRLTFGTHLTRFGVQHRDTRNPRRLGQFRIHNFLDLCAVSARALRRRRRRLQYAGQVSRFTGGGQHGHGLSGLALIHFRQQRGDRPQ